MTPNSRARASACRIAFAVGLVLASNTFAQTPGFHALGSAPGTTFSTAMGVSADGRRATGYSGSGTGFLWTDTSGRYDFGLEAGVIGSTAYAISGDGSTVVGQAGGNQAFRWNGPGSYQRLGTFGPYPISSAAGVSGDGSVVVGRGYYTLSPPSQAFRWTAATGMVGLGFTRPGHFQSEATAVSRDGNTIVGWSMDAASGATDGFAWTTSEGMQILAQPAGFSAGFVSGVSYDGRRIVGMSSSGGGTGSRAMLWTDGVPQNLGVAPGWARSKGLQVSDDGAFVLGQLSAETTIIPAVWTSATGFVPFADYLSLNGISVPAGYSIRDVNAMSGDGRTFCGEFGIGNLPGQAFVVTIPAPGAPAILFALLAPLASRRRR